MNINFNAISFKLTLAFLFVGLIGAGLIAIFVGRQTAREFDRFILNQSQSTLVAQLSEHYRVNGSWYGVDTLFMKDDGQLHIYGTLIEQDGKVILTRDADLQGQQLPTDALDRAVPLLVDDQPIGYYQFQASAEPPELSTIEAAFLTNVRRVIGLGALGATIIALLVSIFLARTLTRPIRELTTATQAIATGDLGYQVTVNTKGELGDLGHSFNQMSTDLSQATTLRRQMTADIAHDLRTPLSIVLGYAESLCDGKLQATPEIFNIIHDETQHLSRLVEDLRLLSLADTGELLLLPQLIQPDYLLQRTASAHKGQAEQHAVTISVNASPDLPLLEVDPDRIIQVLNNLVSNAIRYTPAKGEIMLAAEKDNGSIHLRIQDTGIGIHPEDIPFIFERFYRADKSRQQNGASGLGLPIAKSIIEMHGGQITAESNVGQGTSFTISLPAQS